VGNECGPPSYLASLTGKYRSVSEGMYSTGTLMERSAASTSLKGGVVPTSCFSQVRICRMRLLASAPGMKIRAETFNHFIEAFAQRFIAAP